MGGRASATVHIVDDDALVRDCLADMAEHAGYRVRAHASAESFLGEATAWDAGCVVVDVNLPGMCGLDLMRRIMCRDPDLPVIMVSGAGQVSAAVAAMKGGAVDFIQKPVAAAAFVRSLAEAADRRRARAAQRELKARLQARARRLSHREWEVMRLITQGASNLEAAMALGISVRTVENHRARVMDKMDASNLSELIRQTLSLGDGAALPRVDASRADVARTDVVVDAPDGEGWDGDAWGGGELARHAR